MKKNETRKTILWTLVVFAVSFLLSYLQIFGSFDALLTDPLYQWPSARDNRIRIITIDEATLAEYGEFVDWSREIPARLVETLNADPATAPAVIAFDVMYISERDAQADARFAEACEAAGNVVTAVNLVYRTEVDFDGETMSVDTDHIEMVEYPYAALREAADYGFANTYFDNDQYIRYARLCVEYDGESIWSLPAAAYQKYAERTGGTAEFPEVDPKGYFHFTYTGKSESYETVSLCDVLEGRVDPRAFAGCIVFVGAYAPGMGEAYNAAIQHGNQMYGVEIQANILEALMEGKTALLASRLVYALIVAVIAAAYYLVAKRMKIVPAAILGVAVIIAYAAAAKLVYVNGIVLRLAEAAAAVILLYLIQLVTGYIAETLRKRKILKAFRQYVAPQVVQEVADRGDFTITLGGEKRHIAVLFVDIRGFTPMSEGLEPEQVVEILNEYLSLTTNSIFKNNGTLDKFIGDATMAVFNAPFDLDDYIYRAVCTARDIAAGSAELERKLMERFGRSVSFGIGVNCGDAVVGNIGCDFRMDYTAIGDTVNTAARLESNAGRGQILISEAVYKALGDRIKVTEVGVIPLKGKSNEIFVYQLDEVLE